MSDLDDDYTSYSHNLRARLARLFKRNVEAPREASDEDFARRPWLLSQEQSASLVVILFSFLTLGLPLGYAVKQQWGREVVITCGGLTRLSAPGTFSDTWVVETLGASGHYAYWRTRGEFLSEENARAYCRRLREGD